MARGILHGIGGTGSGSDECTAFLSNVPEGLLAITKDSNDEAGVGTMPKIVATTIVPGTVEQIIYAGGYLAGNITIPGATDLVSENILYEKNIFGVIGTARKYVTFSKGGVYPGGATTINNTRVYPITITGFGFTPTFVSASGNVDVGIAIGNTQHFVRYNNSYTSGTWGSGASLTYNSARLYVQTSGSYTIFIGGYN